MYEYLYWKFIIFSINFVAQFTNLAMGQTYDIVWHLGYAHKGGFQIDLLDSNGKVVKILTPNGFVGNESTNET